MHFVTLLKFTNQGLAAIGDTTLRARKFQEIAAEAGVNVREMLWTQGRYDGVVVFDAQDAESASAAMLHLSSDGYVQTETLMAFDNEAMERVIGKTK
ncbi:MAG: GYD domain-containing protein [Pirellulaceae bacterium]